MTYQPDAPDPSTVPDAPPPAGRSGCLAYFLFAGAAWWVVLLSVLIQGVAWGGDQMRLILGLEMPWFAWPLINWTQAIVLALPVVPLAIFVREPRFRAAYLAWAVAIACLAALGLGRPFPFLWNQAAALAQALLGLACALVVLMVARRRGYTPARAWLGVPVALALAAAVVAPWLVLGALGSPLDTVLNLLVGLSYGALAGLTLDAFLLRRIDQHSEGAGRDVIFGGLAAGITLHILGSGFGVGGQQLILMVTVPAVAFAAVLMARLARAGHGWLPMAALVGAVAAAPLLFTDPKELTLLLGPDDALAWIPMAVALSLLLGWLAGVGMWIARRGERGPVALVPALGGAAVAWLAAGLLYLLAGQPGWHGERLFVVLRDQADLSQAYAIADREARVGYVYKTLVEHAEAGQAELRAELDGRRVAYTPYYLVNALEVEGGPFHRWYLSRRPEVDRVLDSPRLRPLPWPAPVAAGEEEAPTQPPWNITSLGADLVWVDFDVRGRGIVVGQSDSGVQGDHPALQDGYRGRAGDHDYHWLDPWYGADSPTDISGHGTHTLGSVLGRGGIGVAPEAEWIGCVNLARNLGNPALYLDCLQFTLAPYPRQGDPFHDGEPRRAAHVLNNSWGCPSIEGCDADSLRPATRALRAAGIFVVASAGNEGSRCGSVQNPIAIYPEVFTVGASDFNDNVAWFSSRGPVEVDGSGRTKPDLLAPGVDILSAFPGSTYTSLEGTSMAGPHVAGVVALMWSAQPRLIGDIERTERILVETAWPYSGEEIGCFDGGYPNYAYGYGLLDAYAAVEAALALD